MTDVFTDPHPSGQKQKEHMHKTLSNQISGILLQQSSYLIIKCRFVSATFIPAPPQKKKKLIQNAIILSFLEELYFMGGMRRIQRKGEKEKASQQRG